MKHQLDRHVQILKRLPNGAARAELTRARANDLVINAEFRHPRAFNPLREEVPHVAAGDLRRHAFEIIDRRSLVAILIEELAQQFVKFLFAQRLAQHAKHHRPLVVNDRLIRCRLIVQRRRRSHDR